MPSVSPRAARTPRTRTATTTATTASISSGTRSAASARASSSGCAATCSRPRTSASTTPRCTLRHERHHYIHGGRDDGRRRRAAPAGRVRLLRRHRPPLRGGEPGAADERSPARARVRERDDRSEADPAAALDRRRRARRNGRRSRFGAGDLRLLAPGGPDRRRLPRRRADRSLREPEQHRDRPYASPKVRPPGAGGAPEIATSAREVFVMLRQSPRTFVDRLDFRTTPGTAVSTVVTDLGILEPRGEERELTLISVHPGVDADRAREATGWDLRVAE